MSLTTATPLSSFLTRHGVRQSDVARALGVTEAAISYVVNGKNELRVERVRALLVFLRERTGEDVTFEQLFEQPALPPAVGE